MPDPGRRPAASRVARPDVGRGQQQAGVVCRLQRELDGPGRGVRLPAPPARQPEARAHRPGRSLCRGAPVVQGVGELGGLGLVLAASSPAPGRRSPVSAAAQRSATGIRDGRRPARAGSSRNSGSRPSLARADASASASRASVTRTADGSLPASARHSGGIAAASSLARCASGPDSTGRHLAA